MVASEASESGGGKFMRYKHVVQAMKVTELVMYDIVLRSGFVWLFDTLLLVHFQVSQAALLLDFAHSSSHVAEFCIDKASTALASLTY